MKKRTPPYNGMSDRDEETYRWGNPPVDWIDALMGACIVGVLIMMVLW